MKERPGRGVTSSVPVGDPVTEGRSMFTEEDLTQELLKKAADEALDRPRPSAFSDDRLFATHGVTFSWTEQGDDLTEESNYHSALYLIREAAGADADDHVIDATIKDWAVGYLRQIFVQIYVSDSGEDRTFTPAFRKAVELAMSLRSFPILDEGDYSERESERHEENMDALYEYAHSNYGPLDTDEERAEFEEVFRQRLCDEDQGDYPDLDWNQACDLYKEERNAFFEKRAREFLPYVPSDAPCIHENQLTLFEKEEN